jgi:hypothetical protein
MQYDDMMPTQHAVLYILTERKRLPNIYGYVYSVAKCAQQTYSFELTQVSVPAEDESHQQQPSLMSTKDQYRSTTLMPILFINKK